MGRRDRRERGNVRDLERGKAQNVQNACAHQGPPLFRDTGPSEKSNVRPPQLASNSLRQKKNTPPKKLERHSTIFFVTGLRDMLDFGGSQKRPLTKPSLVRGSTGFRVLVRTRPHVLVVSGADVHIG